MESLIVPSSIQRIRSFLVEMCGMKVKPWATTEETLAALHTTLVARRQCQELSRSREAFPPRPGNNAEPARGLRRHGGEMQRIILAFFMAALVIAGFSLPPAQGDPSMIRRIQAVN